jgi:hypothetical protein
MTKEVAFLGNNDGKSCPSTKAFLTFSDISAKVWKLLKSLKWSRIVEVKIFSKTFLSSEFTLIYFIHFRVMKISLLF